MPLMSSSDLDAQPEATVPRLLFRYRPFRNEHDSLRKILVANEWYFGSRQDFDDQADCVLTGVVLDRNHIRDLMVKAFGPLTADRESQIEQYLADPEGERRTIADVQKYINDVGILCLSELYDDPELWRVYANDGKGVCLCLETLKIAYDEHYLYRGPWQVTYSDSPKQPWDPRGDRAYQLAQTEDHLLRKSSRWRYQQEWRFFMHKDAERTVGYHPMPQEALCGIICGPRMTATDRQQLRKWIMAGPFRPTLYYFDSLEGWIAESLAEPPAVRSAP
jgi:hypothetical protein